ncbi:glutamate transport system permease protein [Propionibacterium cyclohexanicum]|uniref:Glutamate transport system permease protein n=1 Tax=Propionibacterium cyclohexanicum TaxID=64702 RepID=A0A1H9QTQ1_9ACTN|nr:amino acid ABC transporter permease [Propionibacterium cyclohexanicum]SER63093.1 glutamate transport system permease protein [Propionibacterium cyclohexanicum]
MSEGQSVLFDVPGPRTRRRNRIIGVVGGALILALLAGLVWGLREQLAPRKWQPFADATTWTAYLLPGLLATLRAAVISVLASSAIGLLLGMGRLSHVKAISWLCGLVVEFFRSVPVLMMMVFSYYAYLSTGLFSGDVLSLMGVVTGLTVYNSCVMAELVRAGVHGLPAGQLEAGQAIGLTHSQVLRSIQLPQAISAMLPSLVSQLVIILKDTALGYMITYPELLRAAQYIDAVYGNLVVGFLIVAVIFYILNWSLTRLAHMLEARLRSRRIAPARIVGPGAPLDEVEIS